MKVLNNGGGGAGIGGNALSADRDYGNIVINCGEIDIQTNWGAGIGSAVGSRTHDLTGSITINGGTIKSAANGGAGIGGGGSFVFGYNDSCKYSSGNIVINGGNITAFSWDSGAGIGGGEDSGGANVIITGGKVNAYGSAMDDHGVNSAAGAGIGVGGIAFFDPSTQPVFLGTLHITGGEVTSWGCNEEYLNTALGGTNSMPLGFGSTFDLTVTEASDYLAKYNSADYTADGVPITIADMYAKKESFGSSTRYVYKYKGKTSQQGTAIGGLGSYSRSQFGDIWIQSGDEAGIGMFIKRYTMNTSVLGIDSMNCLTQKAAEKAIDQVNAALNEISRERSSFGAAQNRLEHTVANEDNIVENTTAAESRIRDTDMAKEMVAFSIKNILTQAGQSMLTQANQSQQYILSLLS